MGLLDDMQMELTMEGTDIPIQLLSVNQTGLDVSAGNLGGRGYGIPMLQDTLEVNAWGLWKANLRDFFILDDVSSFSPSTGPYLDWRR